MIYIPHVPSRNNGQPRFAQSVRLPNNQETFLAYRMCAQECKKFLGVLETKVL